MSEPAPEEPGDERPGEQSGEQPGEDAPHVPTAEEVAAELGEGDARRYPSTIGGAFYIAVLVVTGVGIGIVVLGDWRVGIRWIAGALAAAGLLRLVLPARDAGMLAVRHRLFDFVLYAALAAALAGLSVSIPDQPTL